MAKDWPNIVETLSCGCMILGLGENGYPIDISRCKHHKTYDTEEGFLMLKKMSKEELAAMVLILQGELLSMDIRYAMLKRLGIEVIGEEE